MFAFMEGKEDGWCLKYAWNKSAFTMSSWLKFLKFSWNTVIVLKYIFAFETWLVSGGSLS